MRTIFGLSSFIALLAALVIPLGASAQQPAPIAVEADTEEPAEEQPWSYVTRNQTLDQLELRVDVAPPDRALLDLGQGLRFELRPDLHEAQDTTWLGFGAGFGITDRLEGGIAVPLQLGPALDVFELVPYGRYRLTDEGRVQLSAQVDVHVPLDGRAVTLSAGAPLSFYFGQDIARLETGAKVDIDFDDPGALDLHFPVALAFNVTESVFVGGRSGAHLFDVDQSGGPQWEVPIGAFAGYTFDLDSGPIDLSADLIYYVSSNDYRERVELRFGGTFYFDLEGESPQ